MNISKKSPRIRKKYPRTILKGVITIISGQLINNGSLRKKELIRFSSSLSFSKRLSKKKKDKIDDNPIIVEKNKSFSFGSGKLFKFFLL